MKKNLLLTLWLISVTTLGFSQEETFYSQTDFGFSFGKVEGFEKDFTSRTNFSFQTFNGVKFNRYHAAGFFVGVDTYPIMTLMPWGLGWRGFLEKGKRHTLFGGMDLGIGSAILSKRISDEWNESWTKGGFHFNPSIGIRRNSKKRKHAYSLSFGYKRQEATHYNGFKDPTSLSFNDPDLPDGFTSLDKEAFVFNSFILKWGLIF